GQALLCQHLFWFFGHPEVYILILPAMGMVSDIISNGSRKPIFGYHSMVFAIVAIAFLGWIVWGHHMFVSGMNPTLGSSFMVSTLVIAVPSAVKTFNWMGTMWRGNLRFHVPMLHAVAFVAMFVIGGLSGIFMAATPVDMQIHDTYFIVAHLHYVLFGGSLFALFGAITYWYPKMFGRMMSEPWGKVHFWLTFIFYNCTFFPMHITGMAGEMRRLYDPNQYTFLQPYQPMREFISISAFLLFATQLIFFVNFWWSLLQGKKAEQNPWHDNGLEWSLPAPAPHGMWLFFASEVIFFVALSGNYVILRFGAPGEWARPGIVLNIKVTAFNTFLLICSSVSMVKAYASIQDGDRQKMRFWLLMTILGGATFVGIQVYEYTHLVERGFLPSGVREGSELAELVAQGTLPAATMGLYGSTFYTM